MRLPAPCSWPWWLARGSLVSLAAFGLAYYVAYHGTYRAVVHGLLAVLAVAAMLLVIPQLRHGITNDVLKLHDRDRGIDSGSPVA